MSELLEAGGIRCHVLIDGWRRVSPRFVFKGYEVDLHPRFAGMDETDATMPGRFAALLIESRDGVVLVDAGLGTRGADRGAGLLLDELSGVGVGAGDVRTVIVTHGHADHVGGLVTSGGAPTFGQARHIVHRDEVAYWRSAAASALPGDAGGLARAAFGALAAAGLLDEVDGDRRVATGVDLIATPGHTPGHVAVVVGDALLWAGDAIVHPHNVVEPAWVSSADVDGDRNAATRELLLARAADDHLRLAAVHLPVTGRVRRIDDGFAFDLDD